MLEASATPSPDAAAFLQRRVAIVAAIISAVAGAFLLQRIAQSFAIGGRVAWSPSLRAHLVGLGATLLLFALTRFGRRGATFVRTAELTLLALSCIAFTAMAAEMPQVFRPNFSMLLIADLCLLTRAIWIPSKSRWSALISIIIGVPLLLMVWRQYAHIDAGVLIAYEGHDDFFEVTPENIRTDNLVATTMWFIVFAVITSVASGVIHGLRREVRRVRQLGQYVLEKKIGEGAMGAVYRARHGMLRRPTAIKLLLPDRTSEAEIARFEREVQLTAKLTHPNTITVFDYGRSPDGVFYYAMELLSGATLTDVVEIDGAQPIGRVLHILRQAAQSLQDAHEIGLIHRDIKPANIMLCRRGSDVDVVKVLDFGLVKDIHRDDEAEPEAALVGTPLYISPEAIERPGDVDARSDLYSLGAVAYFLLTGEHVFDARTIVEVCAHHLHTTPPSPSERRESPVPPALEALVSSCLAKSQAERPQSAKELIATLDGIHAADWSAADAERWWQAHAAEIDEARPSSGESLSNTVVGRA